MRIHRRQGQVLVVTVLAIVLLVGLIFFIMNVGDQVNRRTAAQNAADSAAMSAAIHMARSMNAVAMNNIATSRMLSLVPIMDSVPPSVRISLEEVDGWAALLREYWLREPTFPNDRLGKKMTEGVFNLSRRLAAERDALLPVDQLYNQGGLNVSAKTLYEISDDPSPLPHGAFWVAARDLEAFSEATIRSAGVAAQTNAALYGRVSEADDGMVVPILPVLPAVRGRWADWYRDPTDDDTVLMHGRIPDFAVPHRLGAYDRLFRWRVNRYLNEGFDDALESPRNAGIMLGASSRASSSGRRILIGYRTYGPAGWMQRRLLRHWRDHLPDAYRSFASHFTAQVRAKLGYMFVSPAERSFHRPRWRLNYPQCRSLAVQQDAPPIRQTRCWVIEIRSKYASTSPRFLASDQTYVSNVEETSFAAYPGWWDPAEKLGALKGMYDSRPTYRARVRELTGVSVPPAGVTRISDYIWQFTHASATTSDSALDIQPRTNADGTRQWFPVHRFHWFLFAGVDVGEERPVRNPANFRFEDVADLPAPYLLDRREGDYDPFKGDHDEGVRRELFTYLGIARRSARPSVWPRRFGTDNPLGSMLALAQAQVYNPTSWDLWTQDWQAQLVPVTRIQQWCDRARGRDSGQALTAGIDEDRLEDIVDYLQRFAELDEDVDGGLIKH